MLLKNTQEVMDYLSSHIPHANHIKFPGHLGLERVSYLLEMLGNPQNKLQVIHIAGTSGKGSTAFFANQILLAHGYTTGLHIKPHILDLRERFQVNGQMISEEEMRNTLNEMLPFIEDVEKTKYGKLTYFEIIVTLAFLTFYKHKVQVAVIETGMGGLFDGTNAINNDEKIVVLTRIGFDHTAILGKTLPKIAYQKAGIIHQHNKVIALSQEKEVNDVFITASLKAGADLTFISPGEEITDLHMQEGRANFSFNYGGKSISNIQLAMPGIHQAENASLATAAVIEFLKKEKKELSEDLLKKIFSQVHLAGRMEILHTGEKTIILDGAHNPQKMQAFLTSLQQSYPNRKFHFLLAFKEGKDFEEMIKLILPLSQRLTISSFFVGHQDWVVRAENTSSLTKVLEDAKFKNYEVIEDHTEALTTAMNRTTDILVITGSLYFIGELYGSILKLKK